jgi:hypothetical protein
VAECCEHGNKSSVSVKGEEFRNHLNEYQLLKKDFGVRRYSYSGFYGSALGIFLFTTASRTALGPTQPPVQWVPRAIFLGVKRPGREADHSPPSSTEVKE